MGSNPVMGFEPMVPWRKKELPAVGKNILQFQALSQIRPVAWHWRELFCSIARSAILGERNRDPNFSILTPR
jgi:hypothetical protein